MSSLSALDWLMLLAAAALASAAVTALWRRRIQGYLNPSPDEPANDEQTGYVYPFGPRLPMTEPTRLSVGVVFLGWAYTLVSWALPAGWIPQVPVGLWPWILGIGVLWAGGSLLMDAGERRRDGDSNQDPN